VSITDNGSNAALSSYFEHGLRPGVWRAMGTYPTKIADAVHRLDGDHSSRQLQLGRGLDHSWERSHQSAARSFAEN